MAKNPFLSLKKGQRTCLSKLCNGLNLNDFASLSNFIVDLNPEVSEAAIVVSYELGNDGVRSLFKEMDVNIDEDADRFYKIMKERVSRLYQIKIHALDPNDLENKKQLELRDLRTLLAAGFITAQRGLDDKTEKESGLLSKSIENLFTSSLSAVGTEEQTIATTFKNTVKGMEFEIDSQFSDFITRVIAPQFKPFGYPSLQDIPLCTSTSLNVQGILKNFSRIGYAASSGVNLPESYNGLGTRNLIFILLKLYEFMKCYSAQECSAGIQLIFIEEPEAHLRPQMQEVFIKNLNATVSDFSVKFNQGEAWPVQFIVTTHSPHLANAAEFSSMRYFSANTCIETDATKRKTEIKDISIGLRDTSSENLEFLHKYMTLTKCDLFFADKMILIEGTSERLMLPKMIEKRDRELQEGEKSLGSDYLSIIEVGGAYAHLFFPLVKFLSIPTLIITDLDSVKESISSNGKKTWSKCKVSDGQRTSNATIKAWFGEEGPQQAVAKSCFRLFSPADDGYGHDPAASSFDHHEYGQIGH
jgi:predicted ATP-dependent endonuclease of OLD family